jgi:hypothetical protein
VEEERRMAFTEMSSREKKTILVLAVIIVLAVIGIGFLAAKFLVAGSDQETGITPPAATIEAAAPSAATVTLQSPASSTVVADVVAEGVTQGSEASADEKPVAVVQIRSLGNLLPVMMTEQALDGRRRYRVEIVAVDGAIVPISGSLSQSTKSAGGDLDLSLPKSFEGQTPFVLDLSPGIDNPKEWKVSVSAMPKDLLGDPPILVMTVWDVTGSE